MKATLLNLSLLFPLTLNLSGCDTGTPPPAGLPAKVIKPGDTISVSMVEPESGIGAQNSDAWDTLPQYRLELGMAPPVHPSVMLMHKPDAGTVPLFFRLASDGRNFNVYMRWPDPTDNAHDAYDRFSDGAAIQFALSGGDQTSYMMGTTGVPVNIWYWKGGSDQAQDLAAAGFGNTSLLDSQNVAVSSNYSDKQGEWNVVFSRPLAGDDEYHAILDGDQTIFMSFAIWQGEEKHRDGLKRTSTDWITVEMENNL